MFATRAYCIPQTGDFSSGPLTPSASVRKDSRGYMASSTVEGGRPGPAAQADRSKTVAARLVTGASPALLAALVASDPRVKSEAPVGTPVVLNLPRRGPGPFHADKKPNDSHDAVYS
jgi:hypothetical protein